MPDNSRQIARAKAFMAAWHKVAEDGPDTQLRDFLCDLMHYCAASKIDFDHELSMATDFYAMETDGAYNAPLDTEEDDMEATTR